MRAPRTNSGASRMHITSTSSAGRIVRITIRATFSVPVFSI
jgi:hypothetical protein